MDIFIVWVEIFRHWLTVATGIPILAEIIVKAALTLGVIIFVLLNLIVLVWLERKLSAFFQMRRGPNRLGPAGFFQFPVDIVKMLGKEDIVPANADRPVFLIASICAFLTAIMAWAVIPLGRGLILEDLSIGIFYFIAIGSTGTIAFIMAGFSSNNKYALLGGMRAAAQMISYEIPMVFSLLGVIMITGSLTLSKIVEGQKSIWFIIPQILAFLCYFISSIAETNRGPFDMTEGEQELVGGYFLEYSGIRYALFMVAEYTHLVAVSAIAALVFLGGWNAPFGLTFIPGFIWMMLKIYFMIFLFMWVRWTFPRIRIDHLMHFGWKVLIPVSLINIVLTGIGIFVFRAITG
ncbi:MAG: NADH-quinone oxidoreductase subunit H [Candidatus Dichloromethanomonas elyunquensis]|nr:MAG: NADH-quinone oxidoreductase subunit H [Candidatus Dichloromethanomonas elyunquensis]